MVQRQTAGSGTSAGRSRRFIFPRSTTGTRLETIPTALRTGVHFTYGEYIVKIPNSPSLIFDVLSKAYPAHWVGLPISTVDASVTQGLKKTWGFDGFTVYPNIQRDLAIKEYTAILGSAEVCNRGVLM